MPIIIARAMGCALLAGMLFRWQADDPMPAATPNADESRTESDLAGLSRDLEHIRFSALVPDGAGEQLVALYEADDDSESADGRAVELAEGEADSDDDSIDPTLDAPRAADATRPTQAPAEQPGPARSTGPKHKRVLRVTAYCDSGVTASGAWTRVGQCAAPADVPFGSRVYVPALKRSFIVTDRTHRRFRHNTIDIFIPSEGACLKFGRRYLTCEVTPPAKPWRRPRSGTG